jgi:hypothetical protein
VFGLKLVNQAEVRRGHEHFLAECERMLDETLHVAGKHSIDHVQRYPAFKPRTGRLQRGQKYQVRRLSSGRLLKLYNDVSYANPIDKGARPHIIRPRRARALRFVWHGELRFFAKVNHPGNRPYKFAYRAWRSSHRVGGDYLARRMAELAARF